MLIFMVHFFTLSTLKPMPISYGIDVNLKGNYLPEMQIYLVKLVLPQIGIWINVITFRGSILFLFCILYSNGLFSDMSSFSCMQPIHVEIVGASLWRISKDFYSLNRISCLRISKFSTSQSNFPWNDFRIVPIQRKVPFFSKSTYFSQFAKFHTIVDFC